MDGRILITGATGYLGSRLARALAARGCGVVALKRKASGLRRLQPLPAGVALHELEEGGDMESPFRDHGKIDAVIHAATCYGRNGESAGYIADANLRFPLRLMEAAAAAGTGLFLNTGTALDGFPSPYALSKRQFAEWGRLFAQQRRIRFINLRLEHFFGEDDDDSKFTAHVIRHCLANAPELKLTPGEQKRDFIYIDDVVSAYVLLLEKRAMLADWLTELDVGSGEAVTVRRFAETVRRLAAAETRLDFGAYPYREGEVMFAQADTAALQRLGWQRRYTLEQGLERTMGEYRK